ncbi:Transcriptional regulatory protein, C terminal [Bradyrhizobium sp. Gha]|nr:Transcriptional regulatory protein, C terminal [Bradyrhizobium sp. Gha]
MRAAYQRNIEVSDRTIVSHIRNIRAKLAALSCENVIETIQASARVRPLRERGMRRAATRAAPEWGSRSQVR